MGEHKAHDTAPAPHRAGRGRGLTGTGMDLIVVAQRFRYAVARLPRPNAGLRTAGVTNGLLLTPLLDEITKARRRRIAWPAIATELARAGVHKLSGAPFTAADLRSYMNRSSKPRDGERRETPGSARGPSGRCSQRHRAHAPGDVEGPPREHGATCGRAPHTGSHAQGEGSS
uniref:Uncharacterized protein n=1 Tax=Azospirillum brasilense TaxID=192 RepID=F2Q6G4_AZOBR|nr:hypothetical protein Abr_p85_171-1 [Azospirillum baldaniorum]